MACPGRWPPPLTRQWPHSLLGPSWRCRLRRQGGPPGLTRSCSRRSSSIRQPLQRRRRTSSPPLHRRPRPMRRPARRRQLRSRLPSASPRLWRPSWRSRPSWCLLMRSRPQQTSSRSWRQTRLLPRGPSSWSRSSLRWRQQMRRRLRRRRRLLPSPAWPCRRRCLAGSPAAAWAVPVTPPTMRPPPLQRGPSWPCLRLSAAAAWGAPRCCRRRQPPSPSRQMSLSRLRRLSGRPLSSSRGRRMGPCSRRCSSWQRRRQRRTTRPP